MRRLWEALTLREALARARARSLEEQAAVAHAWRRSRELASAAENLWLAGAPGAIDAARGSLEAAIEAAAVLAPADDEAGSLRALGLDPDATRAVLDARGSDSLRALVEAARRVRRAIGGAHRSPAELRRRRRLQAAAAVALGILLVVAVVRDIRRRVELAHAPWAVSYWDNPDFQGAPSTRVGWRTPSRDWGAGGPFGEDDAFSLRLETCLRLEAPATVGVVLRSDDGSRAYLDGDLVVDNWGDHGPRRARGQRALEAGAHRLRVDYYERGGGAELAVGLEIDGPYELSPGAGGCD